MNKIYHQIHAECVQAKATLVAVSKTRSVEQIMTLYHEGQRVFGENRVQELIEKQAQLPKDIQWHLIGHLQTNKVKQILPFVELIHSVDSLKLLREIEKEATHLSKKVNVLLQMHVAEEESKFGLSNKELVELLDVYFTDAFQYTQIVGVMGMATNTTNREKIKSEFHQLNELFHFVKNGYFIHKKSFCEISMGMSSDYKIALEEGSTMVRVGSMLFDS